MMDIQIGMVGLTISNYINNKQKIHIKDFILPIKIKVILSLLFITTFPAIGADGDEALFGLRWGMTVAEVKSAGVKLTRVELDRNLDTYKAPSMPKNLTDFKSYSMMFANGKLIKMWGISKDIYNDPNGYSGKERFNALKYTLIGKYGKPKLSNQTIGNKLFEDSDEFYQCLSYSGCGQWAVVFETIDKTVGIELKGLSRGTGYLDITAEAIPQFSQALKEYEFKKDSSDKDAL